MKKSNNKQDRKFRNQTSHLSSFIGMPMWNGRNPTLSEIRELDRCLLEQQAIGFEPKQLSIFVRLSIVLKLLTKKVFAFVSNAKLKTRNIEQGISSSAKTDVECCG